eukprot:Hpha_TRINITY_DN5029_c0_g1::TRINITY_DN5029_c0_g1_i1::g.94101::m.94101
MADAASEPPPPSPVAAPPPPAEGGGPGGPPVNWEKLLQESLQYEARRRVELDEYEKKRKEAWEAWEKERREALDKEAASLRESAAEAERRRAATQSAAEHRVEEIERRLKGELREVERKRAEANEALAEIAQRRKHLDEDQALTAAFVTRVSEQQGAVVDEVQRENEELRGKLQSIMAEAADLRGQQKGMPKLDEALQRAERFEEALKAAAKAVEDRADVDFAFSDHFVPVLQWLAAAGLTRFASRFSSNEFDLAACAGLTESDLDAMDIRAVGARRKLLVEAAALRQRLDSSKASGADAGVGGLTPRTVLELFYQKYDPPKVAQVPDIVKEYEGDLSGVFATVSSLYPISVGSPYSERLSQLLRDSAPCLVPCCDILLDLYQGREVELLGYLMRAAHAVGGAVSPQRGSFPSPARYHISPPRNAFALPPRPDEPPPEGYMSIPGAATPARSGSRRSEVEGIERLAAVADARDALTRLFATQGTADPARTADFIVTRFADTASFP